MRADVRRVIEMSKRALSFSVAHPHPSQGYAAALTRLQKAVAEADLLAGRQQNGINAARGATGVRRKLRRKIRIQLVHLFQVAESASAEVPDLDQKFRLGKEKIPYLAFRTAARGMLAEAQNQKELLIRHGLLETVLQSLAENLDKFDAAVEEGTQARRDHVGASAELDVLAQELTQVVRLNDGINQNRFFEDADSLAQWESASNVIGPPKAGSGEAGKRGSKEVPPAPPPSSGDIKPAA